MNLSHLTDEALLSQTKTSVIREREMTMLVLHHLKEVERRRLFASLGFSSLFDYATRELGYCAAAACRRIDAMRLLKELPAIENKIQEGKLSLSTVARAQSFFKKEMAQQNKAVSVKEKAQLMESLENRSTREVERELIMRSSQPEIHLNEKVRPVTADLSEMKVYVNEEVLHDLERLKGLLAHSHPNMTTAELVGYLAKLALKKLDPGLQEAKRMTSSQSNLDQSHQKIAPANEVSSERCATSAPNESLRQCKASSNRYRSRYVPRNLVRAVWSRDQSRCTWVSSQTGKRCESTYRLQVDHVKAYALGGGNTFENLRLLCFHHNQFEAEKTFGRH